MSYTVFARKYRPQNFDQVLGQGSTVTTLKNAITERRIHQAYLFSGARGVGKTSMARIFAKSINCEQGPTLAPCQTCPGCVGITQGNSLDVMEIDGASHTGVDDVRELREQAKYLPTNGRYKIYIIDEVHMLSQSAFNALLKILEEPPAHVIFVFATTEPHKIPITILSRCQRFDYKRLTLSELVGHLSHVLDAEGLKVEEEGLRLIARAADGSVRDSLSLLDQVVSFCGSEATAGKIREMLGLVGRGILMETLQALLHKDAGRLLDQVARLYDQGFDLKIFSESLLEAIRNIIVIREGSEKNIECAPEELTVMKQLAPELDTLRWIMLFQLLARGTEELARSEFPRFVMEATLIKMVHINEISAIPSLIDSTSAQAAPSQNAPMQTRSVVAGAVQPPTPLHPVVKSPMVPVPQLTTLDQNGWRAFVDQVLQMKPQLGSLLDHAHPLKITEQELVIGVEEGSVYQDMLKDRLAAIEEMARTHFGHPLKIGLGQQAAPGGITTHEQRLAEDAELDREIKARVLANPVIQQAQQILGATIKEVRRLK